MSEPTPIAGSVAALRAALEAGRPGPTTEIDPTPDDGEDEETMAEIRAGGFAQARAIRWAKVAPSRFADAELDDFRDRAIYPDLVEWAHAPRGRNLVLFGPIGVGKSRAALAACRPGHDAGLEVRYHLVAEALDLLRPGGPDDALDTLAECDRLVLDDLGTERPTDWTAERLGILIDRRWREERPTVVTANLELHRDDARNQLLGALGQRSYSRIVGDGAVVLRMTGPDLRRRNAGDE